jgi:hypothetical protein
MTMPKLVVVVVCLHSLHPPDLVQPTLTPPGNVVVFGLQSGLSGSAFVHSQVTVVVAPKPPPPPPIRAMTITPGATRISPGFRSTRTLRGGELVRFG